MSGNDLACQDEPRGEDIHLGSPLLYCPTRSLCDVRYWPRRMLLPDFVRAVSGTDPGLLLLPGSVCFYDRASTTRSASVPSYARAMRCPVLT
eukprot:1012241-Rhodomonas_salina.5